MHHAYPHPPALDGGEGYFADREYLSNSMLSCLINDGEKAFRWKVEGRLPDEPTKAMLFGRLGHAVVLEGASIAAEPDWKLSSKYHDLDPDAVVMIPDEVLNADGHRRGPAYTAWSRMFKGSTMLTPAEFDQFNRRRLWQMEHSSAETCNTKDAERIQGIVEALHQHASAEELLWGPGESEQVLTWELDGIKRKGKLDRLCDMGVIADLKIVADPSPRGFASALLKRGWHRQAYWYIEGVQANVEIDPEFIFIAVKSTPPFNVEVYDLLPEWFELAEDQVNRGLQRLAQCQRSGIWESPTHGMVTSLAMPGFAKYESEWEASLTEEETEEDNDNG